MQIQTARTLVLRRPTPMMLLYGWIACAGAGDGTMSPTGPDLTGMSIAELMNQPVQTASKSEYIFSDTAAAVYVLYPADIRRSGATGIADALRMVPGFHVARIDSSKWAVSGRGFNGRYAAKLLVMIDDRPVYTPTFSGVYWETLDLVLDDIERIEVVRGPGASVWGANAFNGVVNVITKSAEDTAGGLISLLAGNEDRTIASARYGGELGEQGHFRVYAKKVRRDGLANLVGGDAGDDWQLDRTGFRMDLPGPSAGVAMLQGDLYHGILQQNFLVPDADAPNGARRVLQNGDASGGHLLGRWQYSASASSRVTARFFLDYFRRMDTFQHERRNTLDLDLQHEWAGSRFQEIVWGFGYRLSSDAIDPADLVSVSRRRRDLRLFSLFGEDRLRLFDNRLELTLGAKLEHHTFSGWQFQPSLQGLWKLNERQRLWGAVSRAARTPSRGEIDGEIRVAGIPTLDSLLVVKGNSNFGAERVVSWELGYRAWPVPNFSIDLSTYYNEYDNLRFAQAIAPTEPGKIPLLIVNGERAWTYGIELAADWRVADWVRVQASYTLQRANYSLKHGYGASTETFPLGDRRDPEHLLYLSGVFSLPRGVELDVGVRYVDAIPDITLFDTGDLPDVDAYWALDARLTWHPEPGLELSLVGRDLNRPTHLEYLSELATYPTQVERSIYGLIKWTF